MRVCARFCFIRSSEFLSLVCFFVFMASGLEGLRAGFWAQFRGFVWVVVLWLRMSGVGWRHATY